MPGLVGTALETLKSRLDANRKLKFQRSGGYSYNCTFKFYKPAAEEAIDDFEEETGFTLPSDYREFLTLHDGVELYIEEEEHFIDHWYIFSLDEIEEYLEKQDAPDHMYPIAMYWDTLSFELWFDFLIVAQGEQFWHWPSMTPDVHEKLKKMDES